MITNYIERTYIPLPREITTKYYPGRKKVTPAQDTKEANPIKDQKLGNLLDIIAS